MSGLHKVIYSHTTDDIKSQYQYSYKDFLVDAWLEDNCKHSYYHNPGWTTDKFIQFECSVDAINFALRWT